MIRKATQNDVDQIINLYRDTITIVNLKHYTPEQVKAWAGRADNVQRWLNRINTQHFLVMETDEMISDFASVTLEGYIDMLFTHWQHQGKGIAGKLLSALEHQAKRLNVPVLTTDASITARPVFERFGFEVIAHQTVDVDGISLNNFKMTKAIS